MEGYILSERKGMTGIDMQGSGQFKMGGTFSGANIITFFLETKLGHIITIELTFITIRFLRTAHTCTSSTFLKICNIRFNYY